MQTFYGNDGWLAGRRKLVVHYHIFKNAGTSIDEYLASQFGKRWIAFEGAPGHEPIPSADLAGRLSDQPAIECVSSHKLRPARLDGYSLFPIVLIRDPLDRAYSCYSHSRRSTDTDEGCDVARAKDFPGYVEWCLDNPGRGGVVIVNYQTVHLSRASWLGPIYSAVASRDDLKYAIKLIDSLPVPGTVDLFDEFMVQLHAAISTWRGQPMTEVVPVRANVSPERPVESLHDKKASLRTLLGPRLAARFEEANALDKALWAYTYARSLDALRVLPPPRQPSWNTGASMQR